MSETKKTKKFCDDLVQHGAIVIPYVASRRQPSGFPDRIVWMKQWRGWIEFKDTFTRIQPLQANRIKTLNMRQPMTAVVVRFGDTWREGFVSDLQDNEYYFDSPMEVIEWLQNFCS